MVLVLLIRKDSVAELVDTAEKTLLSGDEVDREDNADKQIDQDIPYTHDSVHRPVKVLRQIRDQLLNMLVDVTCPLRGIEMDVVLRREIIEFRELLLDLRRVVLRVGDEIRDTREHRRKYEPQEQRDQKENDEDRDNDGQSIAKSRSFDLLEDFVFKKYDEQVDQIREDQADDDRRNDRHNAVKPCLDSR